MATARQLADDIRAHFDKPILTKTEIKAYTGYNEKRVQRIMAKVPALGENTGARYFYEDVAEAILTDGKMNVPKPQRKAGRPRLLDA